jgi:hypothetical protein
MELDVGYVSAEMRSPGWFINGRNCSKSGRRQEVLADVGHVVIHRSEG